MPERQHKEAKGHFLQADLRRTATGGSLGILLDPTWPTPREAVSMTGINVHPGDGTVNWLTESEVAMNKMLKRLHRDHSNLNRLFAILEEQVARYSMDSDREPDLALILDIIDYLNDYPRLYHHPLEEQAIGLMAERDLGDSAINDFIHHQHRDLEQATKQLAVLFETVANDQPVAIEQIHAVLDKYLSLSRTHLQAEEDRLFPVMEKVLGDSEWDIIASRLPDRRDPLFTRDPDAAFADLSERL